MKLFTFFLLLFLYSCEKDDLNNIDQEINQESRLVSKMISFDELEKNKGILLKLEEIVDYKKSSLQRRGVAINDFYVETSSVRYFEYENTKTYTFQVFRLNNENEFIENLIINELPDGTFTSYLIKYDFTENDIDNLKAGLPVENLIEKLKIQLLDMLDTPSLFSRGAGDPYTQIVINYKGNCYVVNHVWENDEGEVMYNLIACPECSCSLEGGQQNNSGEQYYTVSSWQL